jgi:2-polyprenyl-6-methoxyphenol hydroxylase-like FAD-dependent oxidoreductase
MAQNFDVCILGGGMVGRSLALSLAAQSLRVGLVAPAPANTDVRAYSLNTASRHLLDSLGVWPDETHATPVMDMRVWGDEGGFVHFTAPSAEGLTWIVDVPELERLLVQRVQAEPRIHLIEAPVKAPLTVVCEGRGSSTRHSLGIDFDVLPYQQSAVAARVRCSLPHRQQALQWFRHAHGGLEILALLPLGGPRASDAALVWSVAPAQASHLQALAVPAFENMLEDASHGMGGSVRLISDRAVWPLRLAQARQWTGSFADGSAWVLAGDAAHNIHPLAGLGLNLGLADVQELSQVLNLRRDTDYWRPVGDRRLMRRYERARKADMLPTWIACDGLQRLFAHPSASVQSLRNWGLSTFNQASPLKRWALQQAMNARIPHAL